MTAWEMARSVDSSVQRSDSIHAKRGFVHRCPVVSSSCQLPDLERFVVTPGLRSVENRSRLREGVRALKRPV